METDQDQMEEDLVEAYVLEQARAEVLDTEEAEAREEAQVWDSAEDMLEFTL